MDDLVAYRIALVIPGLNKIVAVLDQGGYVLPRVYIRRWQRSAEQLNLCIKLKWNIGTLVLDILCDDSAKQPLAIVEVISSSSELSGSDLVPVRTSAVIANDLNPSERELLDLVTNRIETKRGPFCKIGWLDDLRQWAREISCGNITIVPQGLLQLNASGNACLLRLIDSTGRKYWLKATSEANARELETTAFLSRICSDFLPRLIAIRPEWNAWLMEDHGVSLHESTSVKDFCRAVQALAQLQKHCIGRCSELLASRCGDHRTQSFRRDMPALVRYLKYAMSLQTSDKALPLSECVLDELSHNSVRVCELYDTLAIPDSLIHSDINPGNILFDGSRFVFTDWSEANVGPPFITIEQVCVHVGRRTTDAGNWLRLLMQSYRYIWAGALSDHQLTQGLLLSAALSVLSSLHSTWNCADADLHVKPRLSYARSLARHLQRVMAMPAITEAINV